MLGRSLRKHNVIKSMIRGGGSHWDRPDVPLNETWVPERHYQINDINTWYYDGSMPEYCLNNHELLVVNSDTGTGSMKYLMEFLSKFGIVVAGGIVLMYFLNGGYSTYTYYDDKSELIKTADYLAKEKFGIKKDFMGTDLTSEHGLIFNDYSGSSASLHSTEYYKAVQRTKNAIGEAKTWWALAEKEANEEAQRRIKSGSIGHH